jgi:hypothetical protein
MRAIHPKYITDDTGKKLSVVLPIEEYNALLDELDELDDIRRYDAAKAADEPSLPLDEAFSLIESRRQGKS